MNYYSNVNGLERMGADISQQTMSRANRGNETRLKLDVVLKLLSHPYKKLPPPQKVMPQVIFHLAPHAYST